MLIRSAGLTAIGMGSWPTWRPATEPALFSRSIRSDSVNRCDEPEPALHRQVKLGVRVAPALLSDQVFVLEHERRLRGLLLEPKAVRGSQ